MGRRPPNARLPIGQSELAELLLVLHGVTNPNDFRRWLELCLHHLDAKSAALLLRERATGDWRMTEWVARTRAEIDDYMQPGLEDPSLAAISAAPPLVPYRIEELLTAEVYASHPFFTGWWASHDIGDMIAARVPVRDHFDVLIGFTRSRGRPVFGEPEREFLQLMLHHLDHAIQVHNRLDRASIFADIALEQLLQSGQGLVVLNEDGRIVYANRVANRMIQDNVVFTSDAGTLRVRDESVAPRFEELVRRCAAITDDRSLSLASSSMVVPRAGASPLAIAVTPYRGSYTGENMLANVIRAVVTLFDPDLPRLDTRQMLREMFGLTEIEAEVYRRIGEGGSVDDIAGAMQVTRETVRSQLKRIYAKTGVRRQIDLVRLVLLGPAMWSGTLQAGMLL